MAERRYTLAEVQAALENVWKEEKKKNSPGAGGVLDRIVENAAMYQPVDVYKQTKEAGPGFMNMPGYLAPVDTSELNKIPAFWQGMNGIVKIIASLFGMYGNAMGGMKGMSSGWNETLFGKQGGGAGGLMSLFGGRK